MLSIIIPTYNEEKYLPNLLKSVKKQSFKDYEIIVADNNSKDKTRKIAKGHGCKIVFGDTPSIARNNGAKVSKGEYLLFLDSDVILFDKDFLQKIIKEIQEKKVSIGTCKAKPMDANIIDIFFHLLTNSYMVAVQRVKPHVWGPCIFVSKKVFNKIGGFDTKFRIGEDIDFGRRAAKVGKFMVLNFYFGASVRRFRKEGYIKGALTYLKIVISYWFNNIKRDDSDFKFYEEEN